MTLSIQATEQSLQVVYPQEYRRSLPLKGLHQRALPYQEYLELMQREASTQQRLLAMGSGKDALTECPPHTMSGSLPSDEVGKSYTHPVGQVGPLVPGACFLDHCRSSEPAEEPGKPLSDDQCLDLGLNSDSIPELHVLTRGRGP